MKTRKYGSKIIELMRSHDNSGSGRGKEAGDEHRAKKKIKTKDEDVVCVESSEEE